MYIILIHLHSNFLDMKSSNKDYIIPFEGLKIGKHDFKFHITDAFFEGLAYSIIHGADIVVQFTLNKKEPMLIGAVEMQGVLQKPCDRCSEMMEVPVDISHQVVFKFGEEEADDPDLFVLPPSTYELDISSVFYELLTVALPNRAVHEEEDCNEEMIDLIDEYATSEKEDREEDTSEDSTDPRWDALKKLN